MLTHPRCDVNEVLRYEHLCGPVAAALSSMMDKKDKSWSAPVEDDCGYLNMTRGNLVREY